MFDRTVVCAVVILLLASILSRRIRERAFFSLDDSQKLELIKAFGPYRRYRPLILAILVTAFFALASTRLWLLALPVLVLGAIIYFVYSFVQIRRIFELNNLPILYRKAFYRAQLVSAFGLLICATIIGFAPKINEFFAIDSCLDSGGRWDDQKNECEGGSTP